MDVFIAITICTLMIEEIRREFDYVIENNRENRVNRRKLYNQRKIRKFNIEEFEGIQEKRMDF